MVAYVLNSDTYSGASLVSRVVPRFAASAPRTLLIAAMRPWRLKKDSNFRFVRVPTRNVVRVQRGRLSDVIETEDASHSRPLSTNRSQPVFMPSYRTHIGG